MLLVKTLLLQVSIIAVARCLKVLSFEKVKFREDKAKRSFFSLAETSRKVFGPKFDSDVKTGAGDAD